MIRFGLRLAVTGGREVLVRLVIIALAVAAGVGMLLAVVAGVNAVNAQNPRYAWLAPAADAGTPVPGVDPLWAAERDDYVRHTLITRVDLAATGPASPVPPGLPRVPGPGEYFASPALADLLGALPADQLADRYPGRLVGTIGRAAVPDPDTLMVVVGRRPAEMAALDRAIQISRINTDVPPVRADALKLVLGTVAAGLLFPLLIFTGTATRLSAARREQRYAAMRLVGATPRQISLIATMEAGLAAAAGTALGFGVYASLHGVLAGIPFTGNRFYPDDLALTWIDAVAVALGVPLAAALAARLALRRVRISPLGVSRRVTPRPPSAYRLLPLLLGLALLAYLLFRRPETSTAQLLTFLPGILLVMTGLVASGPWVTMVGARLLAARSRRLATLVAARRLADDPRAAFRAVSGLALALFVATVATGVISTIVWERGPRDGGSKGGDTTMQMWFAEPPGTQVPAAVSGLATMPGVRDLTVLRQNPDHRNGEPETLASCRDVLRVPGRGGCPPGATVVRVWPDFTGWRGEPPPAQWPAAPITEAEFARLPVYWILLNTDGSKSTVERARTVLEQAYPDNRFPPNMRGDFESDVNKAFVAWQRLAEVIIVASMVVAAAGLAVTIASGLAERRRPFSLLRLTGVPLRALRRVVALETAVPLLLVAAVAIGAGLLTASLFLRAQMDYGLRPPGPGYYGLVAAGLLVALAVIAASMPLLNRTTGPEVARNE
ncbi:ABC transporter permease [Plantactinospora siamensis]|uniref:ABC transporter permease n=1 Tax=Plantactinospora siamensis TaxID=555372 RepID=A0ABV6NYC1_9ACTN